MWRALRAAQLESFVKRPAARPRDRCRQARRARRAGNASVSASRAHFTTTLRRSFLDEASSSLDPETEREVMEAVDTACAARRRLSSSPIA